MAHSAVLDDLRKCILYTCSIMRLLFRESLRVALSVHAVAASLLCAQRARLNAQFRGRTRATGIDAVNNGSVGVSAVNLFTLAGRRAAY